MQFLIYVLAGLAATSTMAITLPRSGGKNELPVRPRSSSGEGKNGQASHPRAHLETRAPSSACINSFYTEANPVLSTCKIDINTAVMYLIQQVNKQDPNYVKQQCQPYCTNSASNGVPAATVSVTAQCQTAINQAAANVNAKCGSDVQAATTQLLAATYQKNPSFITAQCAPYCPAQAKTFTCPATDNAESGSGCGPCDPAYVLSTQTTFPNCGYGNPGTNQPYSSGEEQCQYDPNTGNLVRGAFSVLGEGCYCCFTQATQK